jgi:hypothetical protein
MTSGLCGAVAFGKDAVGAGRRLPDLQGGLTASSVVYVEDNLSAIHGSRSPCSTGAAAIQYYDFATDSRFGLLCSKRPAGSRFHM